VREVRVEHKGQPQLVVQEEHFMLVGLSGITSLLEFFQILGRRALS
jgi:hypothetical protein